MPKKLPETLREKVVQLRKEGRTYTEIEAMVVNPETNQRLARPTTISILREAGLTRQRAPAAAAKPTSPSPSAGTPSGSGSSSAPASSIPFAKTSGVDEFMPKTPEKKSKPAATQPFDIECDTCGTEFVVDSEDDVPESCPECGH